MPITALQESFSHHSEGSVSFPITIDGHMQHSQESRFTSRRREKVQAAAQALMTHLNPNSDHVFFFDTNNWSANRLLGILSLPIPAGASIVDLLNPDTIDRQAKAIEKHIKLLQSGHYVFIKQVELVQFLRGENLFCNFATFLSRCAAKDIQKVKPATLS